MARLQQKMQAAVTTGKAGATGIPCAMVLRLIARSPRCPGFDSHLPPGLLTRGLIPASGDQDHTPSPSVKLLSSARLKRAAQPHGHRIPPPTFVTIASRPSRGNRMQGEKHGFRKNGSEIFLRGSLDRGNQVEVAEENRGFGATNLWDRSALASSAVRSGIRRTPRARDSAAASRGTALHGPRRRR
jgi:hypothetical protein